MPAVFWVFLQKKKKRIKSKVCEVVVASNVLLEITKWISRLVFSLESLNNKDIAHLFETNNLQLWV
jgi:hypothetical protein